MRRSLLAAGASLVVFCACDFMWLGVLARDFYGSRLGALLLSEPNWVPAALFYPLYVGGLCVFCGTPALAARSGRTALNLGAFFGLVAYATYALSNLATLNGWPLAVPLARTAWARLLLA